MKSFYGVQILAQAQVSRLWRKFSQEAKELVNGNTAHLGRLMISMGLQMVAKMHKEAMEAAIKESESASDESLPEEDMPPPNSRLH